MFAKPKLKGLSLKSLQCVVSENHYWIPTKSSNYTGPHKYLLGNVWRRGKYIFWFHENFQLGILWCHFINFLLTQRTEYFFLGLSCLLDGSAGGASLGSWWVSEGRLRDSDYLYILYVFLFLSIFCSCLLGVQVWGSWWVSEERLGDLEYFLFLLVFLFLSIEYRI